MLEALVVGQQVAEQERIDGIYRHLQALGNHERESTASVGGVLVERRGSVGVVTIDRGRVHNALDLTSWVDLRKGFQELGEDEEIRAVVLQGDGDSFCAGADVSELRRFGVALLGNLDREIRPEELREMAQVAYDYFCVARHTLREMDKSPFVIIGKMRGAALGIGNILAHSCDRRIADTTVKTGVPAGRLGIMLDPREIWRLLSHVGVHAEKIIYSGDIFGFRDSQVLGQVDTVVEPDRLDDEV